jgi:type VI secretion system secreted protein Hcp
MAVEIFLKIEEPTVDGESKTKGFEKQVEVFGYQLGASNPSSVGTGSGSGAGKVSISSLNIQKLVDMATPKLFGACCNGTHFGKGTLTVREAGGTSPVDYLILELKQVFVDTISWGGSQGGGKPSESISMSFAEVKVKYQAQSEKGAKGDKDEFGWNVQTNAEA